MIGPVPRICLVTAIIDSRNSVAADPVRISVITKLYLGILRCHRYNAVLHANLMLRAYLS